MLWIILGSRALRLSGRSFRRVVLSTVFLISDNSPVVMISTRSPGNLEVMLPEKIIDMEPFEGMLVNRTGVVTDTHNLARYGEFYMAPESILLSGCHTPQNPKPLCYSASAPLSSTLSHHLTSNTTP